MNLKNHNRYRPTQILVVDDDLGVCEFFMDLFEDMDIPVDIVNSGTKGLQKIYANSYKLIFLDIKLGDRNGLDILEGIRKVDKNVKVIMISGYLTEGNIERALKSGADGYLYKPLQVRDIVAQTMKYAGLQKLSSPEKQNESRPFT